MIDPLSWIADVLPQLQQVFGARLRYLGLQGSYRRGEATETSDIDLVVLLDSVELDDLDAYRAIAHAMPEGEKACGFIGGIAELLHWPRHELFAFKQDTTDYYGKLDEFLPVITDSDAAEAAKIGASTLLHLLTHSYLYAEADARPAILKEAYKAAFFVMLVKYYCTTGVYCRSKTELRLRLQGTEQEIIAAGQDFAAWLATHSEKEAYSMLRHWCSSVLIDASEK